MSLQSIQVQDLVDTPVYDTAEQAIQDALHYLLLERPDLRILIAVRRYRTGPELSLADAAELAGVSPERMKEILAYHNVPLHLELTTSTEVQTDNAQDKIETRTEQSAADFLLSLAGIFDIAETETSENVKNIVADYILEKHKRA